jgi:hypothetical protein
VWVPMCCAPDWSEHGVLCVRLARASNLEEPVVHGSYWYYAHALDA